MELKQIFDISYEFCCNNLTPRFENFEEEIDLNETTPKNSPDLDLSPTISDSRCDCCLSYDHTHPDCPFWNEILELSERPS